MGPRMNPPPPNTLYRGSLETYESSLAVGAEHSILFKAPGAQFVTLAGSSQANILSEMHFSRCLSERSKHDGRVHRSPPLFLFLCSDSHRQNESIYTKWIPDQKQQAEPAEARAARTASGRVSDSRTLAVQPAKLIALLEPHASSNVA